MTPQECIEKDAIDIQPEINRVFEIAKRKNPMVDFIACFIFERRGCSFELSEKNADCRMKRFKTWKELVEHVDNLPERNEILFKKFEGFEQELKYDKHGKPFK